MSKMTASGRVPSERCIGPVRCKEGVCCARKRYSTARKCVEFVRDKIVAHRCRYDGACAPRRRPSSPSFSSRPRPLIFGRPRSRSGCVHGARSFGDPSRRRPPERLHLHRAPPRRENRRSWKSVRRTAADVRGLSVSGSEPEYKRLIAIDGKPIDPAELRKRDPEHEQDVEDETQRRRAETPAQQARRLERAERDRRPAAAILEDAFKVFEPTIVAREAIGGASTIVVDMTARPNARVSTREGGWMKEFQAGRGSRRKTGSSPGWTCRRSTTYPSAGASSAVCTRAAESSSSVSVWVASGSRGGSRSTPAAGRCCSGRSS